MAGSGEEQSGVAVLLPWIALTSQLHFYRMEHAPGPRRPLPHTRTRTRTRSSLKASPRFSSGPYFTPLTCTAGAKRGGVKVLPVCLHACLPATPAYRPAWARREERKEERKASTASTHLDLVPYHTIPYHHCQLHHSDTNLTLASSVDPLLRTLQAHAHGCQHHLPTACPCSYLTTQPTTQPSQL